MNGPIQESLRAAAVLFPLTLRDNTVEAVLTVRNQFLRSHPGQISFPGGKVEEGDLDIAHTAVREAFEELGIAPEDVAVIGTLETCVTGTGFSVVPVLGIIPSNYPYRLDHAEVDEVFHVPLAFLLDESRHQRLNRVFNGVLREYYAIDYGRYHIWGATARIIVELHARLRGQSTTDCFKRLFSNCEKA